MRSELSCYPESENGYEIFGADFMCDAAGRVYLLEINNKIGLPANWPAFADNLFGAAYEIAIGPMFEPGYTSPSRYTTPLN
jgi:hypothetical protein